MKDKKDFERITLSIGLSVGFLTLIYSLNNFLPEVETSLSFFIRTAIYVYLGIAVFFFFLFLLLKGTELKYLDKGIIDFLGIRFPAPKTLGNFSFDWAVNLSLASPLWALLIVYHTYFPRFISKWIEWNPEIISLVIFAIFFFSISLVIDYLIFKNKEKSKKK